MDATTSTSHSDNVVIKAEYIAPTCDSDGTIAAKCVTSAVPTCDVDNVVIKKCVTAYGNPYYLINDFRFTKHHLLLNGQQRWRCSVRNCLARLTTLNDQVMQTQLTHAHDREAYRKVVSYSSEEGEQLDIRKGLSTKGQTVYIINNYKFCKHHELLNGQVLWRCNLRKCKAKITTINDNIVNKQLDHNHECSAKKIKLQALRQRCRKRAAEELTARPSSIVSKELQEEDGSVLLSKNEIKKMKINVYHARNRLFPPVPDSIESTVDSLQTIRLKTDEQNEDFLLINDKDDKVIVFSTVSNLAFLCQQSIFYLDGNSSYVAKFFEQFYTIHVVRNGCYIPLVYCLLPDKNFISYNCLLNKVKDKCILLNLNLAPSHIFVDFDQNMINAARVCWPRVKIQASTFHLIQTWKGKIKQLYEEFDEESDIKHWLKTVFSLLYLAPEEVKDTFENILMPMKPDSKKLSRFCAYLQEHFINDNSMFPPSLWAENTTTIYRTTDAFEQYHNVINTTFYRTRPNIYIFIQMLQRFQTETYDKLRSDDKNVMTTSTFDPSLKFQLELYKQKIIDRMEFLKSIAVYSK